MTVQDIYQFIDSLAPFEAQASFDNAGLLVGDPQAEVTRVLFAMDVTSRVLDEAEANGIQLIVTHHPMMFSPIRRLVETDSETKLLCRMIRSHMALIAAHTNLDQASGGINDVLARVCGLQDVTGEGYWRIGRLPQHETAASLSERIRTALNTEVRVMGQLTSDHPLRTMIVASGAGSDAWEEAVRLGADVFLSGEIKHHHALALSEHGILALECGHFATEEPGIFALADALQKHADAVQ